MAVIWQGSEDIDFSYGLWPVPSLSGAHRGGWCNIALQNGDLGGRNLKGAQFGALTAGYASAQISYGTSGSAATRLFGFGLYGGGGTAVNRCLVVGIASGNNLKLSLATWDGTTHTQLATESAASVQQNTQERFDMQVTNWGASANVIVWMNFIQLINFTGDITQGGIMNNFDCFVIPPAGGTGSVVSLSETFVTTDSSLQYQGLQSLQLNGQGTTNLWTNNTYSNINANSYSDATPTFSNTNGQNQQYNVQDPFSTGYTVASVKQTMRAAQGAGSAVSKIQMGYNSGGTVGNGTGSIKTITTSLAQYEQYDVVNPVTGVAWTQSDITNLQFNLQAQT